MSTYRALLWTAAAFAVSLAALGAAAGTAWARCGRGSECSGELALGIAAVAPAALLLAVMVLLIRKRAESPPVARLLLIVALAVAIAPLAAFVFRDVPTLLIVAGLFGALSYLAVTGEDVWAQQSEENETQRSPESAQPQRSSEAIEPLIQRMQAVEATMSRLTSDLTTLLHDFPPAGARSNGAHPIGVKLAATPATISLVLRDLHDFEELTEIYGALEDLPGVTDVCMRRFEGSFAWLELTLKYALSADALVSALRSDAHALAARSADHEPVARG